MVKQLAVATGSITISKKGDKGDPGNSPYVTKTIVYYAITSSLSATKNWTTSQPDASASANKGKFLWTRTVFTWSDSRTTENIVYTYIGKDGNDGKSVSIKGSKDNTSQLPTSGVTLGDGYMIDGHLWIYTGTTKSDSTHVKGFENVGKIQGEPGQSATQYYTHIAWMKDSKGNGFTTSNPSGAAFDYFGVLVDTTPTDSLDWSKYEWSYIKGKQGDKGTSVKSTEVTYQIGNSATTPPTGTWSTSIVNITDANPYLWTRTIFVYDNGTKSNPSYSVATRGTKGAIIRQHRGFESGKYKYLSGSGAEEYLDVVYYNGSWYRCLSTYETSSPSVSDKNGNSPRWEIANNFKMIATDVLLAKNASIDMVGTNQINLFYSSGTKMYGSFRVVGSDSDYALWLGGTSGKDAAFSVTGGGKIKANSGSIGAFEITNFTDATGFTFYGLKASHSSTTTIPACDTTLDYSGIGIWSGKNTASDYINIGVGYNGSQDGNSNPSFRNGGIYITGNTSGGASDNLAAICVGSLTPKSGYRAYALDASNGDIFLRNGAFIGAMRPNTSIVSYSRTLGENDCFVVCTNSSSITLTLPSNPREGQMYYLYQANGTVNISSTTSHPIISKGQDYPNGKATWYSGTKNQLSILVYTGSRWYVSYTTG